MERKSLDINKIEELFKSHYKALCNTVNRIVKDCDASEDIVQEVFIRVWKKREEITIDSSFKGYLFKAVSNAALNYLQSRKVSGFKEEIDDSIHFHYALDERNLLDQKELEERIEKAIEILPPKCKVIFVLSRYEEMKYQEIANHLNISVKTVENQMGIALEKLRLSLNPYIKGELLLWPFLCILCNYM